jgi:hypothetical protein
MPSKSPPRTRRRARQRPHSALRRNAPDRELLDLRLRDLGVHLEGSWLERCLRRLHADLDRRGITFHPHAWLSDDWFSPDGVPGIAIPFYLAHPRLMRLERRQMLEVEGGSQADCLKILRHECGHALQHAYQLHRRRQYQKLFGKSSKTYPDSYRPNPASRRYVQHLRLYYAQSHPDEDFAETFAVWLASPTRWRKRYSGWPALKKLEYVEAVMRDVRSRRPRVVTRKQIDRLSSLNMTLRQYYKDKRARYTPGSPRIYDRELRQLFSNDPKHHACELASAFLRRNRHTILRLVARWTQEYRFTVDQVLTDMIGRCRELKLRAIGSEKQIQMDFAMLLTTKTKMLLRRPHNWIAL